VLRGLALCQQLPGRHPEVLGWTQQKMGTGFRNAWIRIWIRITGRTMSRVLFRSQRRTKRVKPS